MGRRLEEEKLLSIAKVVVDALTAAGPKFRIGNEQTMDQMICHVEYRVAKLPICKHQ